MNHPLVSIIIPCYNAEKWVAEAIQSALDQTWPNKEVIVIDDGSTDRSLEVIKSFGDKIRWETGPNRGGCAARNRGLKLAQGEWIQFLDADDSISVNKIEACMEGNRDPWRISYTKWSNFHHEKTPPIIWQKQFMQDYSNPCDMVVAYLDSDPSVPPHAWLVSRLLISKAGAWDETLSTSQDIEYFGRVILNSSGVVFIKAGQAYYRQVGVPSTSKRKGGDAVCSRIRAIDSIADLLFASRQTMADRRAIARRLAGCALEAGELDFSLGMTTLKRAAGLWNRPFSENPSRWLRVCERVFGPMPAFVLRHVGKRCLR